MGVKSEVRLFDPNRVRPLDGQPRKRFLDIQELADSIREIGQTTPGIVTPVQGDAQFDARLVDGERRLRACKLAGVEFRAEVQDAATDAIIFARSLAANFSRQGHDPIEVSNAIARLVDAGWTQQQIGRMLGRTACWVSQHQSLQKLHTSVRKLMVARDEDSEPALNMSAAIELARLPEGMQIQLANVAVKLPLASLRRRIDREYRRKGLNRLGRSSKSISGLRSMCEKFSEQIGPYIDLPGSDFAKLVDECGTNQCDKACESIGELAEHLTGFLEAISSRLTRSRQRV